MFRRVVAPFRERASFQIAAIGVLVLSVQGVAFLLPPADCLPGTQAANGFIRTLWQVHASVLGVSVIVLAIIVTVIAAESDRTRIWTIYAERTRIVPIVGFNLLLVLSEGLAVIQSLTVADPFWPTQRVANLLVTESLMFVVAIGLAAWLFTETMHFMNEDYVETLADRRIVSAIPEAVDRDLDRLKQIIARLKGDVGGFGA